MAATTLPLFLWGDFNKTYTDLVNCEIAGPPHFTGRVPYNFFVKKRRWLAVTLAPDLDEIFDARYDGNDWYLLGRLGSNVKFIKNTTVLLTKTYDAAISYKIIDIGWPRGEPLISGTSGAWVVVTLWVEEYFEVVSATWTINQYAGKWLYIHSATGWQGVTVQIASNTATKIYPAAGFQSLPAGVSQWYVFDTYGAIYAYNMSDGVYASHNNTTTTQFKIMNISIAQNIVSSGWRIYWYTTLGNFYVTGIWTNNLTLEVSNYYIGNQAAVLDLVDYKEYVVLLSLEQIDLIKAQTIQTTAWGVTISSTIFKIVNVTKQFWEHNRWAYVVYNQGLYIVSRRGKFLAVTVEPVNLSGSYSGTDEFTVAVQDQGANIQRHLDPYKFTATYRISIDDDEINIIQNAPGLWKTRLLKYDFSYQGWHYWETSVPIQFMLNRSIGYSYIGEDIYEPTTGYTQDLTTTSFTQSIKVVAHEDTVFSVKRDIYLKIYMGHRTSLTAKAIFKYMLSGHEHTIEKTFADVEYLKSINSLWLWAQVWNNIPTYWRRWTEDVQTSLINGIALVEIPLGIQAEIMTITLEGAGLTEIHIGWMLLSYEAFDSALTSKHNTV